MAGRKGQNLLEQALTIAQAPGRSHQVRLNSLLRLAARWHSLASATIYLPDPKGVVLQRRFSTLATPSGHNCHIPYGVGLAGRTAATLSPQSASADLLHPDEPCSGNGSIAALPLLDGDRLFAVLALESGAAEVAREAVDAAGTLAPVFSLTVARMAAAEEAEEAQRNLSLLSALAKLLSSPQPRGVLLHRLMQLCTSSGLSSCAIVRLKQRNSGKERVIRSCRRGMGDKLPDLLEKEAALAVHVCATETTCAEELGDDSSYRYALCTPLGSNGAALGTMTLFGGPELTAPKQIELAETVARLLSGAMAEAICKEQIKTYDSENEKKLKELSLLYRMSNTMLSTIQLNKLIHLTLTALTSGPTPFFDRAMLFLTNERSGMLLGMLGVTTETSPSLSSQNGGSDDLLSSRWDISDEEMAAQRNSEFCRQVQGRRLELDGTLNIASQAVLEKRLIYIPEEGGIGGPLHSRRSALAASPLIAHGQAVGAVLVDNALTHKPINQEHLRFLQLFTNQAGMAIENSMLYNKIEDANHQLSEAQENLLQKERLAAIGEMAAGIAHELKGPLVSIGGFAGRLARKLPQDTSEWAHADLIVREVLRLEGILSEILLFSKKTTICYTRCDLSEVVKESLAVVTPPLEEKQISVNAKFPRHKLLLLGDGQQLKQVFINIILNALDAMGTGGALNIQVSAAEMDDKEAVQVKISDTGGGIPLESLNSIFTPFFTTKGSGTGLGLPIANRIITNHGGKIQVTNNPGLGVEFRVILPKHW
ncbi:sensor histidine kinase, GAF domain-containing [Citrifermentans bemidjiense Bem]|uniref:histidine kinase n=1 Tax=Citrifermentans bemidjiense (strain ATCC BAA-1014 / DSM 16622 / JCM 12645 / Bem) TaxID=404380 RepID=B5EG81_CITBB|nr:ATP-binding protein [Citrifermentans bemidjiense]ACH40994.1 sensor histidine kinase, GAF domain-containing [Citrifermentans bemidjiense Bem]